MRLVLLLLLGTAACERPASLRPPGNTGTALTVDGGHNLYAPLSSPILAHFDEASKTIRITEQGAAWGVRCEAAKK